MTTQNNNRWLGNHFEFTLANPDFDTITFRCTKISGLGFNLNEIEVPYNGINTYTHSGVVRFNDMSLTVLIDEELTTLEQLINYKNLVRNITEDTYSDQQYFNGVVTMYDTMMEPRLIFELSNCMITTVSDVDFDTGKTDTEAMTLNVTVKFENVDMRRVT